MYYELILYQNHEIKMQGKIFSLDKRYNLSKMVIIKPGRYKKILHNKGFVTYIQYTYI